ncbi:acetyl-CoA synthetase-like protein [Venturia nashicola]|uniref:Acetyl-CoA synthetase-like protein n=1 Tax=Venturia nashicola TaxID=86259 RepID=A0A4Z1PL06_9PEZI|nr:acetyl-CoA synthetase-like protein [Venturia nashicola]TLD38488.1 acetyl-CoA synthetase-like protein [Venturia nashicola]
MSLLDCVFDSADAIANKNAPLLIDASDPDRYLSYNEIYSKVKKITAGLRANGIQPGDCVLVMSFNDIMWHPLYLGIMGAGAVFTGVNPATKTDRILHHMKLTKPKLLIVEPSRLNQILPAAESFGLTKENVLLFDVPEQGQDKSLQYNDMKSWESLLQHREEDWTVVSDPDTTVAHYATTSGTSGLFKAAKLSHSYHVEQVKARKTVEGLPYIPRRLVALPPFHVFATPIVPASIREGIATYIMPRWKMEPYVAAIRDFQISELFAPPPVVEPMAQSAKLAQSPICIPDVPCTEKALCANCLEGALCTSENLKSVRQLWFGGDSMSYGRENPLFGVFHQDARIQPVYGMTEAGWITSGEWPERHTDDSVGRLLPMFEGAKIVDESGKDVAEGESGEIHVKGPCMMLGYIDNPEASDDALDDGGWLRTGDYGHKADGKLFFSGRKKDIIKVNAYQVSPAEVEARLKQHHSIKDAAVIGIEHGSHKGDLVRAYIVVREGTEFVEAEIRSYLREYLSSYEIPAEFESIDSIPKSPTGKIERRVLKERASETTAPTLTMEMARNAERASKGFSCSTTQTYSTTAKSSVASSVRTDGSISSVESMPTKTSDFSKTMNSAEEGGHAGNAGSTRKVSWRQAVVQKTSRSTLGRFLSWLKGIFV